MSSADLLQHFLFSDEDIRGQLVGLNDSYRQVLANHQYPEPIANLIGEFMAATVLLSGTIKFDGILSVQAQGKGPVNLIMAECKNREEIRAIARWEGTPEEQDLMSLLGEAQLVITIDPNEGQRYQGIVPMERDCLAACIEDYFAQSEQLKTRVWLSTTPGKQAAGLLLQAMPNSGKKTDQDAWARVSALTATLTDDELAQLPNEQLLHRLYHEETINLYPGSPVGFKCSCSKERTISALVSLGQEEVDEILASQQQIEIKCEFCFKAYSLKRDDLEPYMMEQDITEVANDLAPSRTLH